MELKSKKPIFTISIITILVIIIAGMSFALYALMNEPEEKVNRKVSGGLVLNASQDELNAKAEESMFTTSMNSIWNFDNGSVASRDAYIGNSSDNVRDIYFEVYLEDDPKQSVLYSSPIMSPGTHLENLKLDEVLEAGSYDAVCKFYLVDENGEDLSEASFKVTINILN